MLDLREVDEGSQDEVMYVCVVVGVLWWVCCGGERVDEAGCPMSGV